MQIPSHLKAAVEKLDQNDCIEAIANLKAQCAELEPLLTAAGKTFSACNPPDVAGDLIHTHELLEQHHARLVALAKCSGISIPKPAPTATPNPIAEGYLEGSKPTATDRCKAMLGKKPTALVAVPTGATARVLAAKARLSK